MIKQVFERIDGNRTSMKVREELKWKVWNSCGGIDIGVEREKESNI